MTDGWDRNEKMVLTAIESMQRDIAASRDARETQNIELAVLKKTVAIYATIAGFISSAIVSVVVALLKLWH